MAVDYMRPARTCRPLIEGDLRRAYNSCMQQAIVGYRQDEEQYWIAELACGHSQHVRHNPPWFVREWVTTEQGRRDALGRALECPLCDREAQQGDTG